MCFKKVFVVLACTCAFNILLDPGMLQAEIKKINGWEEFVRGLKIIENVLAEQK